MKRVPMLVPSEYNDLDRLLVATYGIDVGWFNYSGLGFPLRVAMGGRVVEIFKSRLLHC